MDIHDAVDAIIAPPPNPPEQEGMERLIDNRTTYGYEPTAFNMAFFTEQRWTDEEIRQKLDDVASTVRHQLEMHFRRIGASSDEKSHPNDLRVTLLFMELSTHGHTKPSTWKGE